ncbi:MAG: Uma2 family endonuclease [Chloroflexi bacterium]|nr:Uma2 family endonuclease [Chloroflexota bacterium]
MAIAITNWPLTLEQFLALPEAEPPLEYGPDGVVAQKMSPTTEHAFIQVRLSARLLACAESSGRGEVFTELRYTGRDRSKVPDVAYYARERLPRAPGGGWLRYPKEAPDLAAEILSPDQSARSEAATCRWYLAEGTRLALLVEPVARRVTAFTSSFETVLRGADRLPLDGVLPGCKITVEDLFPSLD